MLSDYEIEWKFNTSARPWMGGTWESMIKSVKRALKVIVKDRLFTDEALYTFLCKIEAILNQRSLTAISDDIDDFEALTPNHFQLGSPAPNIWEFL